MTPSVPWFQREPYPSVVRVLLDKGLLAEGGTDALRLASRLVLAYDERFDENAGVEVVAAQIDREGLGTAGSPVVLEAATEIVGVLRGGTA